MLRRVLFSPQCVGEYSLLKNSYALSSAPDSGAKYTVFVVFQPCISALLDCRRADHHFFNRLKPFTHSGEHSNR